MSGLEMHYGVFWVGVYDLPLKLRSKAMVRQPGGIVGQYEGINPKEINTMGNFLRIKVKIDLRKALKRGISIKYQDRRLNVFFKFERLPTSYFVCGMPDHQLKDCEELGESGAEGYEEIEENDLSFGPWLRASPLTRNSKKPRKD